MLILSTFDHSTVKNYLSAVIYNEAIPHWKGQKLNFQKKIFRSQETHNIPTKKTKPYF